MTTSEIFTLWGIAGYLLGSVPFGLVLCYLCGYGDIRKIGSHSIGTTNVLRTGSKTLALLTLVLDASKAGIIAFAALQVVAPEPYVFGGYMTSENVMAALIAGSMGVVGHCFPVWLKFKGGKGVASAFGFFLATCPIVALLDAATWLAMAFIFKYSSLAALTAAALTPIYAFFWAEPPYAVFYTAVVFMVILLHHANIGRLIKGSESKIKLKKNRE